MDSDYSPERIVCLTEETTETLYLLEEDWRIVGISGFTVRPTRARQQKPVVSAFTEARITDIVDLKPDLVLGFSDIQADIASQLIAQGIDVHVFNQRTIEGIFRMVRMLGAMVGCPDKAMDLIRGLGWELDQIRVAARKTSVRPRVYFEEWNDPLITGIGWVSELIEIAGGKDVFAELSSQKLARHRIIKDPDEVVRRNPAIIIGSWCGKPFKANEVVSRPSWNEIAAVRTNELHEIDSSSILQPGPAALTDGVKTIHGIIQEWTNRNSS